MVPLSGRPPTIRIRSIITPAGLPYSRPRLRRKSGPWLAMWHLLPGFLPAGAIRPGPGLRLPPLEVFAQSRRQPLAARRRFFRFAGFGHSVCRFAFRRQIPCAKQPPMARIAALFGPFARQRPEKASCRSSVVEHSLGKGEVLSSILSGSTIPGSKGRAERGAKLSVALPMPFATHRVTAVAALGIKQNPMPPVPGSGAASLHCAGQGVFSILSSSRHRTGNPCRAGFPAHKRNSARGGWAALRSVGPGPELPALLTPSSRPYTATFLRNPSISARRLPTEASTELDAPSTVSAAARVPLAAAEPCRAPPPPCWCRAPRSPHCG